MRIIVSGFCQDVLYVASFEPQDNRILCAMRRSVHARASSFFTYCQEVVNGRVLQGQASWQPHSLSHAVHYMSAVHADAGGWSVAPSAVGSEGASVSPVCFRYDSCAAPSLRFAMLTTGSRKAHSVLVHRRLACAFTSARWRGPEYFRVTFQRLLYASYRFMFAFL